MLGSIRGRRKRKNEIRRKYSFLVADFILEEFKIASSCSANDKKSWKVQDLWRKNCNLGIEYQGVHQLQAAINKEQRESLVEENLKLIVI